MKRSLILVMLLVAGCGPKSYDNPLGVMMDKTESPNKRLAAARQAEAELYDSEKRLAYLRKAVWQRGFPEEMRTHAIDALVRYDEADAKRHFATCIKLMNNWPALRHLIDTAVERHWTDFTPSLVLNYARPAVAYTDAERPERLAIEKLNPGRPVERVVFETFVNEGDHAADTRQRAAAWQLTVRLVGDTEQLVKLLRGAEATGPMVTDLKAGAEQLHVVAHNMEEVLWLQTLRTSSYRGFWSKASAAVAALDEAQRVGLELRHMPVLVHLHARNSELMRESRAELLSRLQARVDAQQHHLKGATYDGGSADHPQRLKDWHRELGWADLATCLVLSEAMQDANVRRAWFKQADADHHDKSTEYGGLIKLDETGAYKAALYKPFLRKHDLIYYATEKMVTDAYTSLAHYHFHAQQIKNSAYASPGRGDRKRIGNTQRFNGLVVTSIDANRLNVDFYRHGDVVIDLGTVNR